MDQELEVKFLIADLTAFRDRIRAAGATETSPRKLEKNLRFDTRNGELAARLQVLRLRQDASARMTFKGPSKDQDGASLRQEIEFQVSDFGAARRLLEALGYRVSMIYEKLRAEFVMRAKEGTGGLQSEVRLMVDEMPFGDFVEIEGGSSAQIKQAAQRLDLDWGSSISESYTAMFARLKAGLNLPFADLTFENFQGRSVRPEDLGVRAGDR